MTSKFFEIVLSDLMNKRGIAELEINEVYNKNITLTEKIKSVQDILKEIAIINNQINTLTSMIPEEIFYKKSSQTEDNNNK